MGMKGTTALTVKGTRKLEAEVVLYSGNAEISAELEKAQTLQPSDFYNVGDKKVPSARALQWLANRKNIKTRIMEIDSTKDYCRATVSGWIGNNPNPECNHNYKEATCEMIFEIEMAEKVLELIYKENKYREKYNKEPLIQGKDWIIGDNSLPMFTNEKMQSKMMREILRMRKFALRTVVTKAERIIHSKLADTEWREEDEIEDEIHEIEFVLDKRISITPKESKPKMEPPKAVQESMDDEDKDFETHQKDGDSYNKLSDELKVIPNNPLPSTKKPRGRSKASESEDTGYQPRKEATRKPSQHYDPETQDNPHRIQPETISITEETLALAPEPNPDQGMRNPPPEEYPDRDEESPVKPSKTEDALQLSPSIIARMKASESPRDAFEIMNSYAMQGQGHHIRALVRNFCPEFFERTGYSTDQIPESAMIDMIKSATGLDMKAVEKTHKCKSKGCKNQLTEADVNAQCWECRAKETED